MIFILILIILFFNYYEYNITKYIIIIMLFYYINPSAFEKIWNYIMEIIKDTTSSYSKKILKYKPEYKNTYIKTEYEIEEENNKEKINYNKAIDNSEDVNDYSRNFYYTFSGNRNFDDFFTKNKNMDATSNGMSNDYGIYN